MSPAVAGPGLRSAGAGADARVPRPNVLGRGIAAAVLASSLAVAPGRPAAAAGTKTPAIRIEGNRDVQRSVLQKIVLRELADAPPGQRWTVAADDAAFAIENLYIDRGNPFAEVAFHPEPDGVAPTTLTFLIDEGPRILLRNIDFVGNRAVGDDVLRSLVLARWGPRRRGPRPFVLRHVRGAAADIAAHYHAMGYAAARVFEPDIAVNREDGSSDIRYEIDEGPIHRIASVTWTGAPADHESALAEIAAAYEGRIYTARLPARLAAAIEEHLANRGHPDVLVTPREQIDPETGRVDLRVGIEPGDFVTIAGVDVSGQRVTREDFIRSRLKLREGAPYSRQARRESFQSLFRTGLFRTVTFDLDPDEGAERRLEVGVVEAPSREVFVEPGYGSYELFRLRLGLRHRNVHGRGMGLRAEGVAAVRAQRARLGLTDPALFGTELLADYPLFWERREEPSFTRREYGFEPSLTWRISEAVSVTGIYSLKSSEATGVDPDDPYGEYQTVWTSSATLSPMFDSRDNFFVPRRGMVVHPSVEYAAGRIGSELEFVRLRHRQSHFLPVAARTVLAFLFQTGIVIPQGDTATIPIQERFFNGGENTVRSFLESELGPKDSRGEPLGGETFTAVSAEIRQDIAGRWQIAGFADAGNVLRSHRDYASFDDLRYGIGIGVRYILPVGPIRLDAAMNPDPRQDEDDYAVHFSVGMAF